MENNPTIIIGAGLAGLACATWLHRAGRPVVLLEAADGPGGRVRTDVTAEGFRLDRGFQILLTDYPEARRMFDYGALNLKAYRSGAVVQLPNGRETTLENPLRAPLMAAAALASPIGTLQDKLLLARLALQETGKSPGQLLAEPNGETTLAFLRRYGWSEQIITNFFRPFFGGVYLDRDLGTASNFFRFLFQQFATGDAAVPALGMQQLPAQLADRLPAGALRLNTTVAAVFDAGRTVRLASGETLAAATTVLATDGPAAARLLDFSDLPVPTHPVANTTTCTYFATGGPAPGHGHRLLHLNARPGALVHNVAFPAEVSAAVAPEGQHLISVSTHGEHHLTEADLTARLRQELAAWFGPVAGTWRHLRTYRIEQALPAYGPGQPLQQELRLDETLWRCGDWVAYPSLNAALGTGRQVAEALLG